MIVRMLRFFGTNEVVLGVASIIGIIGFGLTVFVSIRTNKISKILKYNQVTSQYNRERVAFQRTFEGHRTSVIEDEIRSDKLLKDILQNVEEYRIKFDRIMTLKERITLFLFARLLKKESSKVDFNKVCNYLAILSGRLAKKEDTRNG